MIAVDTNVLVYAHRREIDVHDVAAERLHELASGTATWAIAWPCVYEFFSVVTNKRIFKRVASTPQQAWAQLEAWFHSPTLLLLAETEDFVDILEQFVNRRRVRGPVVHDARVAALCVAHGVQSLLSRDRDFSLFPELRVENPFG